jgi:trans-2,3-dihydro-3-hydroxyanthranilate isomerase
MVPVVSLAAMGRIAIDSQGLAAYLSALGTHLVFPFTLETTSPTVTVHTRGFAPELGIVEDPATGSATGGLGAYLVQYGVIPVTPPTTRFVSEQGIEMGRPSTLFVEVDGALGQVETVRVGGTAVTMIEGELRLP